MIQTLDKGEVVIAEQALAEFTAKLFEAAGMPANYASVQADNLVWANARGIDSHGVLRIPWYVERIDVGDMVPNAKPTKVSETPATALIEAGGAPGPIGTLVGVDVALDKASAVGVGWVVVRNLAHNGALAYYTSRIAARNFIGIATVSSPPNMAPYGAKAPGVHNSPISIAIPAGRHPPIVLDMATSVAAGGKIYFAADRGRPIPEGWALDKDGAGTTDPNKAKIWLPFEGPKGSGLALMFECWSSLLANNPLCAPRITGTKRADEDLIQNVMVSAIDVRAFGSSDVYIRNVDELIDGIKSLPRAGADPVLVPGERENAEYDRRSEQGIVLPRGTTDRIAPVARRFGVPLPWGQDV